MDDTLGLYIKRPNCIEGPFIALELIQRAQTARLSPDVFIGETPDGPWVPAREFKALFPDATLDHQNLGDAVHQASDIGHTEEPESELRNLGAQHIAHHVAKKRPIQRRETIILIIAVVGYAVYQVYKFFWRGKR